MQKRTTTTSTAGSIDWRDLIQGAIMAVLGSVFGFIVDSIKRGEVSFNLKTIGLFALSGFATYVVKKLGSDSKIIIQNPTKTEVKAVKAGEAEVQVVKK